MIILEDNGKDMMIFGIREDNMDKFETWLFNTQYYGCTGISKYKVPKANKMVNVYIISCDTRDGRDDIIEYWIKKGVKLINE